jgi:hypothetical protein
MSFIGLLPHRCEIYRPTKTKNSYGHITDDYGTALYSDVKCRIQYISLYSYISYSQLPSGISEKNSYLGFFKSDTDIQNW